MKERRKIVCLECNHRVKVINGNHLTGKYCSGKLRNIEECRIKYPGHLACKMKIKEKRKSNLERPYERRKRIFLKEYLENRLKLLDFLDYKISELENKISKAERENNQSEIIKHYKVIGYWKNYYKRARYDTLRHYGGVCVLCGEDNFDVLTVHHENGSGAEHRKIMGTSNIYYWLKKNNYPKGFIDKKGIYHRFLIWCSDCHGDWHGQLMLPLKQ